MVPVEELVDTLTLIKAIQSSAKPEACHIRRILRPSACKLFQSMKLFDNSTKSACNQNLLIYKDYFRGGSEFAT